MTKLVALFLMVSVSSCGFFKSNPNIDEETTESPPVVFSEEDPTKVLYNPDTSEPPNEQDPLTEKCDYEEVILIEDQKVYPQIVKNVWYTKSENIRRVYDYSEFLKSDYLHINHATLESVRGDNLFFIDWLKSEIDSQNIVWGENIYEPSNPKTKELNYNGSYNFASHQNDDELRISFKGTARGKSPSKDTTLQMSLYLSSFYNCR